MGWLHAISIVVNVKFVHYKVVYDFHLLYIDYIYILAFYEQLFIDFAKLHFVFHYELYNNNSKLRFYVVMLIVLEHDNFIFLLSFLSVGDY